LPSKHRFTPRARLKVEVIELEPFADHVAIFVPILDLQSTLLSENSRARRPRLPSRTWLKVCSSSSQSLPNYFLQSGSTRSTTELISLHHLLPYYTLLHPTAEVADPHSEDQPQQNTFRPSRKVREPPGGKSTINFAWGEHEEEDALSMAPPKPDGGKEEVLKHTERDSFGFVVRN
jgi:hypothetical protein